MLKAKKKLSKRELKQDKFIEGVLEVREYLEENWRVLTYGLIGVLAVILIGWYYVSSREAAKIEAAEMLSQSQNMISMGVKEEGMALMSELADRFSGTPSAGKATFYLAKIYWEEGDYAQARVYFKRYVDDYETGTLLGQAALAGYADCLAYDKEYAEAARHYERAAAVDPNFPQAAAYAYSAAQAYRDAGEIAKARSLAEKIVNQYEDTGVINRTEILLESLKD